MSDEQTGQKSLAKKPLIAITMGDAAGIGPEVVLRSVIDPALHAVCVPVVIGDLEFLRNEAEALGIDAEFRVFEGAGNETGPGVTVRDLGNLAGEDIARGKESPLAGRAAAEYIIEAVELWNKGVVDAITTAPINKRALSLGGYDFPGHTEFLADLTGTRDFRMSFFADKLRVVLLSTHVPLAKAIELVKKDELTEVVRFADRELSKLLGRKVKLAVAGLNPHASEGGQFGSEERDEIQPAVENCRMVHEIDVSGPFSPDTIFIRAFNGEFDGVVSCYHDQATIAVKCLSFGRGVNVTLGLPLIRTSVDHGTAFDIAGEGRADHSSLLSAATLAADLVRIRQDSEFKAEV